MYEPLTIDDKGPRRTEQQFQAAEGVWAISGQTQAPVAGPPQEDGDGEALLALRQFFQSPARACP